ncbi:MAG: uroporphyrinogen decarboxylase family protein [Planctomycetaceae bacterium]|jgi:MtaA/CmuA family methyltransferase|nr:uroporphyrinogen decarboxylase family protein [Planctomycetaceae bacterium]
MNSYERILAVIHQQQPDRLPLMPITMMFAADQIGVPYGEYVSDYRILAKAQIETAKRFGFDYVSSISDPAREAADAGAFVHFFDDQPPAVDEGQSLLVDKERLKTLDIPDPMRESSRMFDRIQADRFFAEKVKGELFIEGWVEGPCAEAADLRGINRLMLDFIDDPVFVRQLFEWTTELSARFAVAQIQAGCDIIGVGDAAASLVGPKIYRNFVLPYEKQLVDRIHAAGGRARLHICGNINRILPDAGSLGCDMMDIDSMVPLEKARKECRPLQVLSGNLDPVKVLRSGTPLQIESVLEECYRQASQTNYIIAAGCEVPRDTPAENVEAMRHFAEGHPAAE